MKFIDSQLIDSSAAWSAMPVEMHSADVSELLTYF